jgi:hypothetical protein
MDYKLAFSSLLSVALFSGFADAAICTAEQKDAVSTAYETFRSASRSGDLSRVKAMSTPAINGKIAAFEKSAPSATDLARMMGALSPALADGTNVHCEQRLRKARLLISTVTMDRSSGKKVPVTSVVMFEQGPGDKWLVGMKGSTSPFSAQPLETLLQHEEFRLQE